jgi:hypothetical protein
VKIFKFVSFLLFVPVGLVACGSDGKTTSGEEASATTVAPLDFCAAAKLNSQADSGSNDGKSDSTKLFYANQVVAASLLASLAPQEIKTVAQNMASATEEIYSLLEDAAFDLEKVSLDEKAIAAIEAIDTKYSLTESQDTMKKYLSDECGVSAPAEEGGTVPA